VSRSKVIASGLAAHIVVAVAFAFAFAFAFAIASAAGGIPPGPSGAVLTNPAIAVARLPVPSRSRVDDTAISMDAGRRFPGGAARSKGVCLYVHRICLMLPDHKPARSVTDVSRRYS
jgi:hypothetical protein